jgi:hypothetical protein
VKTIEWTASDIREISLPLCAKSCTGKSLRGSGMLEMCQHLGIAHWNTATSSMPTTQPAIDIPASDTGCSGQSTSRCLFVLTDSWGKRLAFVGALSCNCCAHEPHCTCCTGCFLPRSLCSNKKPISCPELLGIWKSKALACSTPSLPLGVSGLHLEMFQGDGYSGTISCAGKGMRGSDHQVHACLQSAS